MNATEKTGKQKLRAALRDMPGARTAELALAAGIGRPTASGLLNKWETEGKVRRETNGRAVAWFDIDADITTATEPTAVDISDVITALEEELAQAADGTPATADSCHCGDDATGHVHPAAKDANGKKGSVDKARQAALDALRRAGVEGMKVSAVWAVMQTEGGIVWVGAYRLLNRMRRENGVTVTAEHKAEDRTARLAPR